MTSFKCACGGVYELLSDDEAINLPPSFTAKLLHCNNCDTTEWKDFYDLDLEEWPEDLRNSA